jgi:hypothetical protein
MLRRPPRPGGCPATCPLPAPPRATVAAVYLSRPVGMTAEKVGAPARARRAKVKPWRVNSERHSRS